MGKRYKEDEVFRWDARVQLYDEKVELDEIFLYGIMSPTRGGASNLAWERAWNMLTEEYQAKKGGLRIIRLEKCEDKTINAIRPGSQIAKVHKRQVYVPPKPFSCPIVDLCKLQKRGTKLGTTLSIIEWTEPEKED